VAGCRARGWLEPAGSTPFPCPRGDTRTRSVTPCCPLQQHPDRRWLDGARFKRAVLAHHELGTTGPTATLLGCALGCRSRTSPVAPWGDQQSGALSAQEAIARSTPRKIKSYKGEGSTRQRGDPVLNQGNQYICAEDTARAQ
jgi:hypothetical protein